MSATEQAGKVEQKASLAAPAQKVWQRQLGKGSAFVAAHPNWFSLVFFLIATIAFTWPLTVNLNGALFDLGDPADSAWRLGSLAYQLLHDPLHLYQSTTLYPIQNVLTLDELLTGNGLAVAPLIWLTNNPVLAFNLLVFNSFALSGFAVYLVARRLTGSSGAGLVAGIIFAFSPWHYAQHGHLGIGATEWLVFALYFLILFLDTWTVRRYLYLALFSFFFAFQALVAGYLAYFAAIIVGLYLLYYFSVEVGLVKRTYTYCKIKLIQPLLKLITKKTPERMTETTNPSLKTVGGQLIWLLVAGGAAGLAILPFVLPFIQTQQEYAFTRSLDEVRYFSASPNGFLLVPSQSWLHRPFGLTGLPKQGGERALYPGLVAVLLAFAGIGWGGRLKLSTRRWAFGFITFVGLILCFGPYLNWDEYNKQPTNFALPYLWLYQHIPGFDALRVPYRFGAIFMLGLAVCAGYGVAALQRLNWSGLRRLKLNWNAVVVAGAIFLTGGEFFAPNLPMQPIGVDADTPPVYKWLASAEAAPLVPQNALFLELPFTTNNPINSDPVYSLYNLQYRRPLLDGSANIVPESYTRLFNEMRTFPSPRSLDVVEGLKVQFLIIHPALLAAEQRTSLDTELKAATRLEVVKSYNDALLLKVKPSNRFAKLINQMPPNSQILLANDSNRADTEGLYTNALIGVLGSQYQYFSAYQTVYNLSPQAVQPHRVYDFAIVYKGMGGIELGYNNADVIFSNETIDVYARRNGLEAFFGFEIANQPNLYRAFSTARPLRLSVTANNVSSLDDNSKNGLQAALNSPKTHSLNLVLAVPQPQNIIIQYGVEREAVHLEAGFYRYFLDIAVPQTFVLTVQGTGEAYLLQARLSSNPANRRLEPQHLIGQNGLIWQSENMLEPATATVDTTLSNYNDSKIVHSGSTSLVVSIYSTNDAKAKKPLPPHHFGQWTLPIPELNPGEAQTVQIKLDLQKQQATGFVNGAPFDVTNLPLSDLDGSYRAQVGLSEPGTGLRFINSYTFDVSHVNNVAVVSNFQTDAPFAILNLPSNSGQSK